MRGSLLVVVAGLSLLLGCGEGSSAESAGGAGAQAFRNAGCTTCHSTGSRRMVGPGLGCRTGKPVATRGGEVLYDRDYIRESIVDPTAKVSDGYAPSMPPYNRLPEEQITQLVDYLEGLCDEPAGSPQ